MPCMVEICFPIRASICICVRSRLEDEKKRKKRLVRCIKQIRNKRWKTFSANLSCHRVWCLAFGAIWKIHLSAVSAKAAFQFCIFPPSLSILVSSKKIYPSTLIDCDKILTLLSWQQEQLLLEVFFKPSQNGGNTCEATDGRLKS